MVMFAVVAPMTLPVIILALPIVGILLIIGLKKKQEQANGNSDCVVVGGSPKEREHPAAGERRDSDQHDTKNKLGSKKEDEKVPLETNVLNQGKPSNEVGNNNPNGPPAVGGAAILAKLRAARRYQRPKDHPVVVLHASQTGTAAEVAKNISSSIEGMGIASRVVSMNEMGFANLTKEQTPLVIWVASSTGDGEAPDNATKFYNEIRKRSHAEGRLHGIRFTGLGLGDSNYTRFMHVPRVLKSRFLELGSKEFYSCGEADEVDGIEDIIDAWIEKLLPAVKAAVKPEEKQGGTSPRGVVDKTVMPLPSCSINLHWLDTSEVDALCEKGCDVTEVSSVKDGDEYSAALPFLAPIREAKYLTTKESDIDRRVIHMQFDLSSSGIKYGPGDSLGVLPKNDPVLVEDLLQHLGIDGDKCFRVEHKHMDDESTPETRALQHIKWPCSARDAFLHGVDLTSPPKKSLLRILAEYCSDSKEKERLMHLCSKEGRKEYMDTIVKSHRAFCDIVFENSSCKPPLDVLLDALPPLSPRMYSISSSSTVSPHKADIAFTAVEYEAPGGKKRKGVATWWLENMALPLLKHAGGNAASASVPLFLRKGGSFSPPSSLDIPWIMIGPGTGVSPFRGFLQQRRSMLLEHDTSAEECWLFFGCRSISKDFLYGDELQSFEKDGILTKLCIAESRKIPGKKVYVQHMMTEHAECLHDMIVNKDAYIFICGDGHDMAKDVHNTLVDIICSGSPDSDESRKNAELLLQRKTRNATYVKDVWC